MKKLHLILLLFCSVSINAQITDLAEFVRVSEMPLRRLTTLFNYDGWNISRPTERVENEVVIGRYTFSFTYNKGSAKQIIYRDIRMHIDSGYKLISTRLTSNDKSLYELIIKELKAYGFKLNFKTENGKSFYSNHKYKIIIYTQSSKDISLSKGYYMISKVKS